VAGAYTRKRVLATLSGKDKWGRFGLGLPTLSKNKLTMAGLDPAIQRARVCGQIKIIGLQTLACWMAGSEAGQGEKI